MLIKAFLLKTGYTVLNAFLNGYHLTLLAPGTKSFALRFLPDCNIELFIMAENKVSNPIAHSDNDVRVVVRKISHLVYSFFSKWTTLMSIHHDVETKRLYLSPS